MDDGRRGGDYLSSLKYCPFVLLFHSSIRIYKAISLSRRIFLSSALFLFSFSSFVSICLGLRVCFTFFEVFYRQRRLEQASLFQTTNLRPSSSLPL